MHVTWLNVFICSARLLAASTPPDKGLIISSHVNDYSYRQVGCHLSLSSLPFPFTKRKIPPCGTVGNTEPFAPSAVPAWQKKARAFTALNTPSWDPLHCQFISPASITSPLWRSERQSHPWCNTTALGGVVAELNLDQTLHFKICFAHVCNY